MTPNEFPYIKAIHVNDCFAYQNFDIDLQKYNEEAFSHLILTGKNGSGKTIILRGVAQCFGLDKLENKAVELVFNQEKRLNGIEDKSIFSFFKANRDMNSDGVLANLSARADAIRVSINDQTYDPCGIVLLDDPEAHLHIESQYHVLPNLTQHFPNVQFIIATHSPAVISSIKNTRIYNLTSQQTATDNVVGLSFSELMVSHFGLKNEFSPIANEIFNKVTKVLKETKGNKSLRKQKLQEIFWDNEVYLSPVFNLELESLIIENNIEEMRLSK